MMTASSGAFFFMARNIVMKLSGFVVAALMGIVLMVGCGQGDPGGNAEKLRQGKARVYTRRATDEEVDQKIKNLGPGDNKRAEELFQKSEEEYRKQHQEQVPLKIPSDEEVLKRRQERIDAENKGK